MHLSTTRRLAGVLFASLAAVPVAAAQRPTSSTDSARHAGMASREGLLTVTAAQIADRGYSTLTDLLRDLPGMETVEQYFSEVGTAVAVRGLAGNNAIVLLIDGMRVNPPGDEELPLRRDVSIRAAERVDVRYGPGTLEYGQNAVSLVINIVTGAGSRATAARALVGVGTLGTREAWAQFGATLGGGRDSSVRLSGFAHRTSATHSRLDERFPAWWQRYADNARGLALPAVPARASDATNLLLRLDAGRGSVQAWYRESARSSAEGGVAPVLQYVREGRWRDRTLGVEARHHAPLAARLDLASSVTYNRYEVDPESRYVFPVNGALFLDDYKYALGSSVGIEEQLLARLTTRITLAGTMTATFFDITPKATVPGGADRDGDVVRQAGTLSYYTSAGNAGSRVDVPRATHLSYRNMAGALQAHARVTDALRVSAGGRVDANTRFGDTPFSPRVDVHYAPAGSRLSWHYSYARGFVSPGPYYGYNVYDNGVQLNVANPDLQPERARSHEARAAWRTGDLQVTSSVFANQQSNLFLIGELLLPVNIVAPTVYVDAAGRQPRVLTRTANGGRRTARGADLSARMQRPWGEAWGSYSFVDVSSSSHTAANSLGGLSAHNVRAGITWRALSTVTLTPSLTLRSTPNGIADAAGLADALELPYEVNAHLRWQPRARWELFVNARNLTDRRYALRGILTPTPQEGRVLMVGVRVGQ